MKITDRNSFEVHGWMRTELDLKGYDLLAYAIIYGFSQEESQWCTCGLQYFADWMGVANKQRAREIIQRLVDRGIVTKQTTVINDVTFCKYRVNSHTVALEATPPVAPGATNNIVLSKDSTSIDNNNIYTIENNPSTIPPIVPQPAKRFTPPTLDEVTAYCESRHNDVNPQRFIAYYESNGWKVGRNPMKDWKAAVRTWEAKEVKHTNTLNYGHTDNSGGYAAAGTAGQTRERNYDFQF